MKLLRQAVLQNQEGNSDSVYEIDLCEVGSDQFVVNFRYGRRGAALRDGSKTAVPVAFAAAERIYDELLAAKMADGYRPAGSAAKTPVSSISPAPIRPEEAPRPRLLLPRDQAILRRISQGHDRSAAARWRLSRAIWRAGQVGLHEAAGLLPPLVGKGDRFLDYSIAWTLGRVGDASSQAALRQLQSDTRQPYMVRRMAAEALRNLADEQARSAMIATFIQHLPSDLRPLAVEGSADQFQAALTAYLQAARPNDFSVLEALYLIDNPQVRPGLLHTLREGPLDRNYFQRFRYLFKSAEFRLDAEVFGILNRRFERGHGSHRAFRPRTREYLRRRCWRTLRRLGDDRDPNYVKMATGVLLAFSDEDAQRRTEQRFDWSNYRGRGRYQTIDVHWDDFGYAWSFSQILFGQSSRYRSQPESLNFVCTNGYTPGQPDPPEREESYAPLWEQQPAALVHLLMESRCRPVHLFAVKILRSLPDFCQQLGLAELQAFLAKPYEATAAFAFELAEQRYDPAAPDRDLALAVINCSYAPARQTARSWIDRDRHFFLADAAFVLGVIASPQTETRAWARTVFGEQQLDLNVAEEVAGRAIALLLELTDSQGELAGDIAASVRLACSQPLRRISGEVIRDLLAHPLPQVQRFAGQLVLDHETFSQTPPADVVQALLGASDSSVREMGARILDSLPSSSLSRNPELLTVLLVHPQADVRQAVRRIVLRLVAEDEAFARRIVEQILDQLASPGAAEGAPTFLSNMVRSDLLPYSQRVPLQQIWRLLRSRSTPAQEAAGAILTAYYDGKDLTVGDLIELASHSLVAVRQTAWKWIEGQLPRLRRALAIAVRLLDSPWDDTRGWACELFRQSFDQGELPANVLIGVCDSVRPDIQQFGRELITRHWNDDDGPEYLRKLSEHPAPSLQLFATNFLERYAGDRVDRLKELTPYFLTVLSQVNRGRMAKDRVLGLLSRAASQSEEAAAIVADIAARQSATAAIGDRARLIELMADIRRQYPQIALPLLVRAVPVRQESVHGI